MKKKFMLSVAAAAAIFAGSPVMEKADAASIYPAGEVKVVYYQNGSINQDVVNNLLKKYYPNLWNYMIQQQVQEPVKAPEQNSVEQPAEEPVKVPEQNTVQQPAQKPAPAPAEQPAPAPAPSQVSAYEQQVVDLTNQERAKYGLKPLVLDTALSKVAREKSHDMQSNGYFDHTSPTYGSPFDMMKKFGITYRSAGENIAMGQRTPEEVVKAWMNSEGHRKNILSSNFTHIGAGHITQGNYWTQMFIGK